MAVVIRLARHGRHKLPYYRIVVADHEMKRDGRHLEVVGALNPLMDPPVVELNEERVRYWIGVGATPSDSVSSIIDKKIPGYLSELEKNRRERIRSKRAARKARTKARAAK